MNKKGMSLFTLILVLMALTIGAAISMGNITPEKVETIKANFTINEVNLSMENFSPELENAFNYYLNGLLNAYEELVKWTMSYTADHPEIPYKILLYLLLLSIFAPILIVVFKLLVIIFLLIKEVIQSRKEKRKLARLKK